MKILYMCEICGFTSPNKRQVQRCERQPRPLFKKGDEVEVPSRVDPGSKPAKLVGYITKIFVGRKTHNIAYNVRTDGVWVDRYGEGCVSPRASR